jgi:hypothetical protein
MTAFFSVPVSRAVARMLLPSKSIRKHITARSIGKRLSPISLT